MQQYAGIYLLQNYSTFCGCLSHPSSGVHQTVTAASGTASTFRQRGLIIIIIFIQLQLGFHPVVVVLKTRIQGYLKIRHAGGKSLL